MPHRRQFLALAAGTSAALAAGCTVPGAKNGAGSPTRTGPKGAPSANPSATATPTPTSPTPSRPATTPDPAIAALDVRAENARPGDPDWSIGGPTTVRTAVEGFADRSSVVRGGSFGLHITSTAGPFRVRAFRLGWYGGAGARLVWTSPTVQGRRQPAARVDRTTRMVRTDWPRTLEIDTAGWPEGSYLLRVDAERGSGRRFIPITVASPQVRGRVVIMNAPATWQAYNTWGGHSLYQGPDGTLDSRSLQVGLDRPYDGYHGAGLFMVYEQPLIAFAERLGLPLAYLSGIGIGADPDALRGATAMISPGHDEYWSTSQRAHVTAARQAGTNFAVLGANACYRRTRLDPADSGPDRIVVCYKGDYAADPKFGQGDPATNDYRSLPDRDPESSLLGVLYEGFPADESWRVSDPKAWMFTGTRVRQGDSFEHLVGVEFDRVNQRFPTPRPLQIVAHSPVSMPTGPTHHDSAYATFPGGAGLFATGTMRWVEALKARGSGRPGHNHGLDARTGRFVRRVTANVLTAFSAGPAAHQHPATDNVDDVYDRQP